MSKKTHFDIGGMTCISCQNKIQKALRKTKGVVSVSVSYSEGTADIEYDEKVTDIGKLERVIEDLDYQVLSSGKKRSRDMVSAFVTLAIIAILYYLLQRFGLLNKLVPSKLADTGMGYGMLFVIGLVTSVHCIAMCGGINLSQSLPAQGKSGTLLPTLLYNLGRVCSYTVIGMVLGLAGSILGDSGIGVPITLQATLKILIGLVMVVMGINMLGIFPKLRRLSVHTPTAVLKYIGKFGQKAKTPFIIGLLNGVMPCGPLQAMWVVAIASGNPFSGGLSMLMFGLGTIPLMLGLGSAVTLLGKKFSSQVMKAGAVLVVVLGLAIATQGGALGGIIPSPSPESPDPDPGIAYVENELLEEAPQVSESVQEIRSDLIRGRYPEITVQAGVPVRWTIDAPAENINGCNGVMIIPEYEIRYAFQPGENIIEFTPEEPGTYGYSCWMGMIYGSITVTE
ncbi:MAG: sulfite exporter TauE/SafE family protein [Lachnospiraceae bacterium]|nr:sulfite exporter TauE/SafE family protein [Lachnospiraceae bacterium]